MDHLKKAPHPQTDDPTDTTTADTPTKIQNTCLAIADAAIVRWKVDPAILISAAEAIKPNVTGRRRALWVAQHARAGIESPLESLARAVILQAGFPEPTPQVWIQTRSERFRVDLVDEANRVITEADGKLKYTEAREQGISKSGREQHKPGNALWQEKRREDALRDAEYEVVRFTMADYKEQAPWLDTYRRALARSTARPMHP